MAMYAAPATFDDLICEYDHFIEVSIYRVTRGSVRSDDLPDLKQAIYLRLLESGYLEKYQPSKGSFSNYLYFLIRSVLCNVFAKNHRAPTNMAVGIQEHPQGSAEGGATKHGYVLLDDVVEPDFEFENRQVATDTVDRLEMTAQVQRDGAELVEVMRLLYEGRTPVEIRQFIDKRCHVADRRRQLRSLLEEQLRRAV